MAVALLLGGVGALVAPAISSATPAPPSNASAVAYALSAPSLSFPTTSIGTPVTLTETITATSATVASTVFENLGVRFYSNTGAPDPVNFTYSGLCHNKVLNFPGGPISCTESITFSPTVAGTQTGVANFTDSSGDSFNVPINGTATGPIFTPSTGVVDFGNVVAGTTATGSVTITNIGDAPGTISNPSVLTAPADTHFHIVTDGCSGHTLAINGTCTVTVSFENNAVAGPESTNLRINPAPPTPGPGPINITLQANGVAAPPGPTTISPNPVTFGNVFVGTGDFLDRTVVIANGSTTASSKIGNIAVTSALGDFSIVAGGTCVANSTVLTPAPGPGSSCTVVVEFSPNTVGTENGTLTVSFLDGQPDAIASLSGNGITTTYTITPGPIDFGSITYGGHSPIADVVVHNNGSQTLDLGNAFVGPQFHVHPPTFIGACAGALLPGQSCTIGVTFDPTSGGNHSTTLVQPVSVGLFILTPLNVGLTGFGSAPMLTITPDADFGNVAVGTSSPTTVFTIKNVSLANIQLATNDASIAGFNATDFLIQIDGCSGVLLTPGQTCQVSVEFHPTTFNLEVAELIIQPTGGLPVLIDPLTGTGVAAANVTITPTGPGSTFDFGHQQVGTTSVEQQFTVKNNGPSTLLFFGPAAVLLGPNANDFQIVANGCFLTEFLLSPGVAPGGSCTVDVVFAPQAVDGTGPESATLGFLDNSSTTPDNIILKGIADPGPLSQIIVSPPTWNFGNVGVGIPSAPETFTVTNSGTTSVTLGPTIGSNNGNFALLPSSCAPGVTLLGGQSCTITVVFTPAALGADHADLHIDVGGFPTVHVPLFGNGVAATSVSIVPNPLNFPNQQAGTASPEQTVTVMNTGTNPLVMGGTPPTVLGPHAADFTIVGDTCTSAVLAPNATCEYQVIFNPAAADVGPLSATFNIADNAAGSPQVEHLFGLSTAQPAGGTLTADPTHVDFGFQGLFLISPERLVTFTNNSTGPLTISLVEVNGNQPADFHISNGTDHCTGVLLDPGSHCTVGISFRPGIIGPESAELDATFTGGVLAVPLTGTGVPPATDAITTSNTIPGSDPIAVEFGPTQVGDTSNEQYVTIKNTEPLGGSDVHVFFHLLAGAHPNDFTVVSNTCDGFGRFGIAPQQVCVYGIVFNPQPPNVSNPVRDADLIIKDNTNGDAQTVHLRGEAVGADASYTVTPNPLAFGNVSTGTTSAPGTATVTNTTPAGGFSLIFPGSPADVAITGAAASQYSIDSDLCSGATVGAVGSLNNTCTVDVVFHPTVTGPANATLVFTPTNGVPESIKLTGNGVPPGSESIAPLGGALEFGDVIVNKTQNVDTPPIPNPQVVTITNTSTTAGLAVGSITILGTNAADYTFLAVPGDCPATPFVIAIGQSCQVTILFTPSALGHRTGVLNIVDNAPGSPHQVTLDGTGVTAPPEQGYWLAGSDGGLYAFGAAKYFGSLAYVHLNAPIVGLASTITGNGYWMVGADGGIFTFGDAQYYGSTGAYKLNAPIVGIAATPTGHGYWIVAADGGIFSFGDAHFYGSVPGVLKPGQKLNKPIVAITKTPDGGGYLIVASDGGVFAFGDATYHGSAANFGLVKPINALVESPDGGGYLMSASDGGIFAFGDATYYGGANTLGLTIKMPIVGMSSTPDFKGYWQSANDGGVFAFGDAQFHGSIGNTILDFPPHIIAMAADPVLGPPGG